MTAVEIAAAVLGSRARPGVALAGYTTYRVGGPAALFVTAESEDDLALVARAKAESQIGILVVGRGSNLLVADSGFDGLAVTLGERFAGVDVDGLTARAGGAEALPVLARRTAAAGLHGLEWAVGVPGSVGGGVRMNAGGHGSDIAATLRRAWLWNLGTGAEAAEVVEAGRLGFGYRRSEITANQVVTAAEFNLVSGNPAEGEAAIREIVRWRREHQPGGANAGSVFANPVDDSAGRLIEAAGAKGMREGSAFVSLKHANFFQADPDGSADDVAKLMARVRALVFTRTGFLLEPEVHLVGFSELLLASLFSGGSL